MLKVQCRLCSSETALISLFNGKSRENRDQIRKLIDITTGIKFQKNDACKCICFPCTVQIYNFFIFRARSIENDEKLQASTVENVKVKSYKIQIPDVEDIILPSIEEIKETLTPWLVSKQNCCATQNNDNVNKCDDNTDDGEPEMVENGTQCDLVQSFDKETQIQPSINEAHTQTSSIATRFVQIQCDLTKRNQKMSKKVNKEVSTQTEAANPNRSVHTQCELNSIKKIPKSVGREMATQTNSFGHSGHKNELVSINQKSLKNISNNTNRSVQCEIIKKSKRVGEEGATQMKSNCVSCSSLLVQNGEREILRNNGKILEKENRDSSTQTESKCDYEGQPLRSPSSCKRCQQIDIKNSLKLDLVNVKQEVESPKSLSPMKSLSINVDGTKTEMLVSPTNSAASPRSSNLLTVRNKIQNVFSCQLCDKTTYSKTEYRLHRKSHLVCKFCKRRFSTIQKTKRHIGSECEVQKLIKPEPVVTLVRLEDSKEFQKKYPRNLKRLSEIRKKKYKEAKDVKRKFRLRSRSMSNVDNVYNNATSCKCCISVLSGISVGVDKSVQANFLFETQFTKTPLEHFCENLFLKRNVKDALDKNFMAAKRVKLS